MKTTEQKEALPFLKPGALGEAPHDDASQQLAEALESKDAEQIGEAVKAKIKGEYRYDRELAKRGVERDTKEYRAAIEWAQMWLYDNRPFYAYCFEDIVRRVTFEVPTLAVGVYNGRVNMFINPDFVALHGIRHNVGFLQHEIGHLIHGHVAEGAKRKELYKDKLVNVAMDLAVDSSIQSEGDQPDWVLLPSKMRIPQKDVPEDKWQNFPERATWEQYYDLLKRMQQEFPQAFKSQVTIRIQGRPKPDQGQGNGPGPGEKGEGGEGGDGELDSFDDHGQWGGENSDSPEMAEHVVKTTVSGAYRKAENNRARPHGYMHGDLIQKIDELLKNKAVPFDRLLRMFVGSQIKVGRRPTVMKLSRRRKVPPGRTYERQLRILWLRDTSGSMSDDELFLAYNELHGLAQDTNVRVFVQDFDYGLQGELTEIGAYNIKSAAEVKGRGGTDFSKPIELINKFKPDVSIIFTDGYAPFPDPPTSPVGWLVTHGGVPTFPWGMVIRMPSHEQIEQGFKARVERWR